MSTIHNTLTGSELHNSKIRTGSGSPNLNSLASAVNAWVGDVYLDVDTNTLYVRKGLIGSNDWTPAFVQHIGNHPMVFTTVGAVSVTFPATGTLLSTSSTIPYSALSLTNSIVNSDLVGNISLAKLATLTASRVAITDASGVLTTSSTTPTELSALSGVTSNIQTQINTKQPNGNYLTQITGDVFATGGGSAIAYIQPGVVTNSMISASAAIAYSKLLLSNSIVNNDIVNGVIAPGKLTPLTVSRAVVTNGSGSISTATATATEVDTLSGVTSSIQTQLNSKQATGSYITGLTGQVVATGPGSASAVIQPGAVTNAMIVAAAGIPYTKLSLLGSIVGSDLVNNTVSLNKIAALTASRAVVTDSVGAISASAATSTEIGFLSGVTSNIQTQISALPASAITALTGDIVATGPGSVAGTIVTGAVTNAKLAGSIADSKLLTISTALKVANSATTATDANVNDAIISRSGAGNFSANAATLTSATVSGSISAGGTIVSTGTMTASTDVLTPILRVTNYEQLNNITTPATPSSGTVRLYAKSNSIFSINSSGVETQLGDAGAAITSLTGVVTATGPGAAATSIAANAITNTMLATISTAGKVSNSATTATSANTASAIVARDSVGAVNVGALSAVFSTTGQHVIQGSNPSGFQTAIYSSGVDGSALTVETGSDTLGVIQNWRSLSTTRGEVTSTGKWTLGAVGGGQEHDIRGFGVKHIRANDLINTPSYYGFTNAAGTLQAYVGLGANTGAGLVAGEYNNGLVLKSAAGMVFSGTNNRVDGSMDSAGAWRLGGATSTATHTLSGITQFEYAGSIAGIRAAMLPNNVGSGLTYGFDRVGDFLTTWNVSNNDGEWNFINTGSSADGALRAFSWLRSTSTTARTELGRVTNAGQWNLGPTTPGTTFPGNRIRGVTNGSAAAAGDVGETDLRVMPTFTNFPVTGTFNDVVSFTLQPGRWLITGHMTASLNGAVMTGGIALTILSNPGNDTTGVIVGSNVAEGPPPTSTYYQTLSIPNLIVNISTATPYYLKAKASYSAGNPQYQCRLNAIRIG